MKILGLDPQESLGSVIAQTYSLPGKTISKGTFITSEIVDYFKEGDVQNILCAVPDNDDIHEDEAANIISNAGSSIFGSWVKVTKQSFSFKRNFLRASSGQSFIILTFGKRSFVAKWLRGSIKTVSNPASLAIGIKYWVI